MGPAERPEGAALAAEAALVDDARRRGFYPVVMLLERLTGGPPVGTAASPLDEAIRFRHDPAFTFSTGDVVSVRPVALPPSPADPHARPRRGYEVTTTFLGLTGAVTPLPHYMAEEVVQEDPDAPRVREFLDLFHHRLLSLLYRGLARLDLANTRRSDDSDPWTRRVLSLLGVDVAAGEALPPIPLWRLLRLAPLLADRTMTAAGLAAAIADALEDELSGAAVAVDPFVGTWVRVADDQLTRLGIQAGRLGVDCLVGQRVLDPAGKFKVLVGPLSAAQYRALSAAQVARRVDALVEALVAEPLEHETVLWLAEDAAPALRLGSSLLGRNAWLGGQTRETTLHAEKAA